MEKRNNDLISFTFEEVEEEKNKSQKDIWFLGFIIGFVIASVILISIMLLFKFLLK